MISKILTSIKRLPSFSKAPETVLTQVKDKDKNSFLKNEHNEFYETIHLTSLSALDQTARDRRRMQGMK